MRSTDTHQLVVVGGGVIGLSTAWRAASFGHAVTVVDPAQGRGASWVAAGMLAPLAEAWPGEDDVLALGLRSLTLWRRFAEELRAASDVDLRMSSAGTLLVAVDAADRETLTTQRTYLSGLGHQVEPLTRGQARRLEPGLGPRVRGGLHLPDDVSVDARELMRALHQACLGSGVRFDERRAVGVQPGAVALDDGATAGGDLIVIAAGADSGALHPALDGIVRPVKGEILRLRARATALPPPRHTVRSSVEGRPLYLVPRRDGELVVGATQYEAGFDTDVTVAGVRDLVRDAEVVWPGVTEYALVEARAGLRAGSRDNLPVIGWVDDDVLVAAGHHRGGLLMAPVTAEAVLALIHGDEQPATTKACGPDRFTARQRSQA